MEQTKLSGYQKLKKENQELRNKLLILVNAPMSEEALAIKADVALSKNIEDAIWAGDIDSQNNEGLLKQIVYEGDVLNERDIT